MGDTGHNESAADRRAVRASQLDTARRLTGWISLSASTTEHAEMGSRETTYRMHVLDLTSRRMVPHLLGVSDRGCDHVACEMVMLNSLTAGYMVEMGWANDHSRQYGIDLLAANGTPLDF